MTGGSVKAEGVTRMMGADRSDPTRTGSHCNGIREAEITRMLIFALSDILLCLCRKA